MTARLALIGAPGSGKSAVCAELGSRWGCAAIDSDTEYERQRGRTVAEAVIDDEAGFRRDEARIVLEALAHPGAVVAVGSGAVVRDEVVQALHGVPTVWLEVGLVDAARRTGLSGSRPLSLGNVRGQLHDMLRERAPRYASVADMTVATDGRTVPSVADEIAQWEANA